MGANIAKTRNKFLNEQIIDASIDYLQENISKTTVRIKYTVNQTIIIADSSINCKDVKAENRVTADTQVFNTMTNFEKINFSTFLSSMMDTQIKNATEQTAEGIGLFNFNADVKHNDVTQSIQSDLSTLISSKTQQIFNADISQALTQRIEVQNTDINCDGTFTAINVVDLRTVLVNVMEDVAITEVLKELELQQGIAAENITTQLIDGLSMLDLAIIPILMMLGFMLMSMLGLSTIMSPFKALGAMAKGASSKRKKKGKQNTETANYKSKAQKENGYDRRDMVAIRIV